MSQRKGWLPSLFGVILVAFVIIVVAALLIFFVEIARTQVTHTVKVVMEVSDSGRKLAILMNTHNATIGISNIELLGNSLADNFDEELLKYVTSYVKVIDEKYFGIGDKVLVGARPETVFSTEIPVPGAGKSGRVKEKVSLA